MAARFILKESAASLYARGLQVLTFDLVGHLSVTKQSGQTEATSASRSLNILCA